MSTPIPPVPAAQIPPAPRRTLALLLPCTLLGLCLLPLAPSAAPARDATISVEEIKPGMKGYGLTVFRGTEPSRFDVEVIDVLHRFRPDQDLILVRTPHPRLDKVHSVAGMSGSPIYLDGRLAGAYAYGWSYGTEPIAGITPIRNMLQEMVRPMRALPAPLASALPAAAQRSARGKPITEMPRGGALAELRSHTASLERHSHGPTPVATPLILGGVTDAVASMLGEALGPLGLEVMQAGPGGGAATKAGRYVDGGALAVQLLRGDIQATAIGTVTHVDGDRLVAFGHPMLNGGELALPTAPGRILHILASQRMSFKMGEALAPLGALVQDRQSAVVVDSAADADPVPVSIHISGAPGIVKPHWKVEAARHRLLTTPLVLSALSSALGGTLADQSPAAYRVSSTVHLADRAPIRTVDAGFTQVGVAVPSLLSHLSVFDVLAAAKANPFEEARVEGIEIHVEVSFGRRATEVLAANVPAAEIDPGTTLPVTVTLRALDSAPETRVIQVPIPITLAGEKLRIHLQPGTKVSPVTGRPRNVNELLANVAKRYPDRSLVVTVQRQGRGARMDGHVVPNLPASAVRALAGNNDTGRPEAFASHSRQVIPMDTVLYGSASLDIEVRKEPR